MAKNIKRIAQKTCEAAYEVLVDEANEIEKSQKETRIMQDKTLKETLELLDVAPVTGMTGFEQHVYVVAKDISEVYGRNSMANVIAEVIIEILKIESVDCTESNLEMVEDILDKINEYFYDQNEEYHYTVNNNLVNCFTGMILPIVEKALKKTSVR